MAGFGCPPRITATAVAPRGAGTASRADGDAAGAHDRHARDAADVADGAAPLLPPVDNYDFYRMLPHPDQWVRVRWWAWRLTGVPTEDELKVWNAWRKEWWPFDRPW